MSNQISVNIQGEKGQVSKLFNITLTCIHCNNPLYTEKVKEPKPITEGVMCHCDICEAKIKVNIEMEVPVNETTPGKQD